MAYSSAQAFILSALFLCSFNEHWHATPAVVHAFTTPIVPTTKKTIPIQNSRSIFSNPSGIDNDHGATSQTRNASFGTRLRIFQLQQQTNGVNIDDSQQPLDNPMHSTAASNANNPIDNSSIISHHVAIKTRNIENAIKFYSLLGFQIESKFTTGAARAAWLLHESSLVSTANNGDDNATTSTTNKTNNNAIIVKSRIELLEVPSHMLNEPEGMKRRAIDLFNRSELLGLNHFALDVTHCIPRPLNDDGASANGTACALYQLQEWMADLNQLSMERFGRSLNVALAPTKRIIGRDVYEMAFLYDADGALVELLNYSTTLEQEVGDGWEPWDGKGFVV